MYGVRRLSVNVPVAIDRPYACHSPVEVTMKFLVVTLPPWMPYTAVMDEAVKGMSVRP
jgi:hypothetical protein